MPCDAQLASVSVATRPFASSHHPGVSLLAYLRSPSVPDDLRPAVRGGVEDSRREYVLTIPTALFLAVRSLRHERHFEPEVTSRAARDVVTCVVGEMAGEIARLFEYQIALLTEVTSLEALADHAADCVIDYVIRRSDRLLDRNTVVQGTARGQWVVVG